VSGNVEQEGYLKILAWITKEDEGYVANWTFPDTVDKEPATYLFSSEDGARHWIYWEAELLGVGVQWLGKPQC